MINYINNLTSTKNHVEVIKKLIENISIRYEKIEKEVAVELHESFTLKQSGRFIETKPTIKAKVMSNDKQVERFIQKDINSLLEQFNA